MEPGRIRIGQTVGAVEGCDVKEHNFAKRNTETGNNKFRRKALAEFKRNGFDAKKGKIIYIDDVTKDYIPIAIANIRVEE